ncbi:hypothetical protein A8B75_07625 [Sphingomonadales bacterium EhC05]|nr:hypothetical protein A8B75_07625 [Sphingomonadales bacterium EhC05]
MAASFLLPIMLIAEYIEHRRSKRKARSDEKYNYFNDLLTQMLSGCNFCVDYALCKCEALTAFGFATELSVDL